jgi:hypothetical protein
MILRSGSSNRSFRIPSNSLSLGLTRQVGSRIAGVSQTSHAGEQHLQAVELGLRQRSALCLEDEAGRRNSIAVVAFDLLLDHRHEIRLHGAAGQLGLHVRLASAQHHRRDAPAQLRQVLVVGRASPLVEPIELAIEAKQRPHQLGVEVLNDRIELLDAVLDRRAGQNERIGRPQRLDPPCRLGVPILDALCFVEDDNIRGENAVDVLRVDKDLLVVHDGEKHGIAIGREPLLAWTEHRPGHTTSEAGNLLLPFRL